MKMYAIFAAFSHCYRPSHDVAQWSISMHSMAVGRTCFKIGWKPGRCSLLWYILFYNSKQTYDFLHQFLSACLNTINNTGLLNMHYSIVEVFPICYVVHNINIVLAVCQSKKWCNERLYCRMVRYNESLYYLLHWCICCFLTSECSF